MQCETSRDGEAHPPKIPLWKEGPSWQLRSHEVVEGEDKVGVDLSHVNPLCGIIMPLTWWNFLIATFASRIIFQVIINCSLTCPPLGYPIYWKSNF